MRIGVANNAISIDTILLILINLINRIRLEKKSGKTEVPVILFISFFCFRFLEHATFTSEMGNAFLGPSS